MVAQPACMITDLISASTRVGAGRKETHCSVRKPNVGFGIHHINNKLDSRPIINDGTSIIPSMSRSNSFTTSKSNSTQRVRRLGNSLHALRLEGSRSVRHENWVHPSTQRTSRPKYPFGACYLLVLESLFVSRVIEPDCTLLQAGNSMNETKRNHRRFYSQLPPPVARAYRPLAAV